MPTARHIAIALLSVAVLGGIAAGFVCQESSPAGTFHAPVAQGPNIVGPVPPSPGLHPAAEPPAPHAGIPAPPDVPQADWDRVVANMKGKPEWQKDVVQVGEYLTFHNRAEQWKQSKAAGNEAAQRSNLDQYLLGELPTHVSRGEMSGWEATTMSLALLQDTISDPAQLKAAEQAELAKLNAASPKPDPQTQAVEQTQMAAYKNREASVIAQWQAMPPSQRDQAWLEKQLDAARHETLDSAKTTL